MSEHTNQPVEWCRTCTDDGDPMPADLIVWGRLFPAEALGPRCIRHYATQTGYHTDDHSLSQSAVYDLRSAARALGVK